MKLHYKFWHGFRKKYLQEDGVEVLKNVPNPVKIAYLKEIRSFW